jgi:hypothetical protein
MRTARVRRANSEDVATVSDVIAAAFYDDPVVSWVFPDDLTRTERFHAWLPSQGGANRPTHTESCEPFRRTTIAFSSDHSTRSGSEKRFLMVRSKSTAARSSSAGE